MHSHFVSRAEFPHEPFRDRRTCVALWWRLRAAFPEALACVLMPNHLHMILNTEQLNLDWLRFRMILSSVDVPWQRDSGPQDISDHKHLRRLIRYTHLNPCRSNLCADPLSWEWSTYRDYMGAAWPCWPDLQLVKKQLQWLKNEPWEATIHKLTSSDQHVATHGTPLPTFRGLERSHHGSFNAICTAAARTFRQMPTRFFKRCPERAWMVQCAEQIPGIDIYRFSEHFGVTTRGLYKMRKREIAPGPVLALQRTLSDRRLIGQPLDPAPPAKFRQAELQTRKYPHLGL